MTFRQFSCLFYLYALGASAHADTPAAVSTLSAPATDGQAAVSYNQWLASSIHTGTWESGWMVQTLTLRADTVAPNENVTLCITGSLNGRPNLFDIRVTFDPEPLRLSPPSTAATSLSFYPETTEIAPLLLPDEDYWLVFGVTTPDWDSDQPTGLYHWSYANSGGPFQQSSGWEIGSSVATGNTAGQNWAVEKNTPYLFSISAQPVPEPSTLLFLAAAVLTMRQRRSRSAA